MVTASAQRRVSWWGSPRPTGQQRSNRATERRSNVTVEINSATHTPPATNCAAQLHRDQALLAADTHAHADAARIVADKAAIATDQRATAKGGSSVDTHL